MQDTEHTTLNGVINQQNHLTTGNGRSQHIQESLEEEEVVNLVINIGTKEDDTKPLSIIGTVLEI